MTTAGVPHEPDLSVDRTPSDILTSAIDRVVKRIDGLDPPLASGEASRADSYLSTLRAKLEQLMQGEDPVPVRQWVASSPAFRPLLQALGEALLHEASDQSSAMASLVVLRVWASVQAPEAFEVAEGADADLKTRMRGPDAFEVLVEVAHDFRSPLTSILFLAEALRDGHSGPVTDVQRSQLGLIYSAAFGLASIASDVMDLARQQKDLIDADAESFVPADVFAHVERMVRPLVEEKGLELRVVVPERWQSRGHPHALGRVLLNLTTNALKFTDEGSVEIGVHPIPHGRLEYYVKDTGRGISHERQKALFQPFRHRSGGRRQGRHFSATGIGLSIARRLLRAMGSDLTLDSSDERGTRFSFVLPALPRS